MRTSTEHTPGPWKMHRNEFCEWVGNESGKAQLAKVFRPAGMAEGTAEANGRLIVAAPELLEAVRKLIRHTDKLGGGCSVSADIEQARAAIAKATGEEVQS